MLIGNLVLPIFVIGLFFFIVLSVLAISACIVLERMPNNENEGNTRNSWTGPERSSYIAILAASLLFIVSSILLANGETIIIIFGIGLMIFSIQIPGTTSILAFAAMNKKRQLAKNSADLKTIGFPLILIAFCSIKTFIVSAITSFHFMTTSRRTTASTDKTVVWKIGGRSTTQ